MKFHEKLKQLRKSMGYTQREFGRILGLTQQHLCDVEKGRTNPGKALLAHLNYRYPVIFGTEAGDITPEFIASVSKPQANVTDLPPAEGIQSAVGSRLIEVRQEWRLTPEEMAQRLGIGPSSYRCYEQGEQDIPSSVLAVLLKAGVDIAWLLEGIVVDIPKKVVGFDAVLSEHFEIVKEFKNKVLAKEINENLVTLESADPELLEEISEYIELKMRRLGKTAKRSGASSGKKTKAS